MPATSDVANARLHQVTAELESHLTPAAQHRHDAGASTLFPIHKCINKQSRMRDVDCIFGQEYERFSFVCSMFRVCSLLLSLLP